jgi:hypothetical protein
VAQSAGANEESAGAINVHQQAKRRPSGANGKSVGELGHQQRERKDQQAKRKGERK